MIGSDSTLVTIDGRVDTHRSQAPIAHGTVYAKPQPVPLTRFEALVVITDDGKRISVTADTRTEIGPQRSATWDTLRDEDDGYKARVRGAWIKPGERVRVIGRPTEHAFVPDTGTHREAPERELSAIKAIAIGVGRSATHEAKRAVARHRRNTAPIEEGQGRARRDAMIWFGLALVAFVAWTMGRVHVSLATGFAALSLTAWWSAQPLMHAPGISLSTLRYRQQPPEAVHVPWRAAAGWAGFLVGVGIFLTSMPYWNPIPGIGLVAEIFVVLPALALCFLPWAMFGPVPDADPGAYQRRDQSTLLPASSDARWFVRLGFVALLVVSCVPLVQGLIAEKARQSALNR